MTPAVQSDKKKPDSVKVEMTGSLRASFQSSEDDDDPMMMVVMEEGTTADESFSLSHSDLSIGYKYAALSNTESQKALMEQLTARFQTNCSFTSKADTPGTHHVSDAIAAFRYTQRFYIELEELSKAYFTEYIRPHKRGAIAKMSCHGSFTQSFVYIVFPLDEEGPVIAYRSCYFRVANDQAKTVDEEATIHRITRFDDILSAQLPTNGLSKECALDARYLIYFLQHYGNEPLEELPPVGDIPAYLKVFMPVKKSKEEETNNNNTTKKEEINHEDDYVLFFEDRPCMAFLELNRDFWEERLAKVSAKYHEHDGDIEKRTMSIVNFDPDKGCSPTATTAVGGKKKFDGPDHTTLRLEPHLDDIGEGWKFFACMLILLSHTISINHGEIYLARCVRACYGLTKFEQAVRKASAAQPYLLRKLVQLRAACFMARSERIYIDHTDLKFKDMKQSPMWADFTSGDIESSRRSHSNPTDDIQMTIVPITHKLGRLHGM